MNYTNTTNLFHFPLILFAHPVIGGDVPHQSFGQIVHHTYLVGVKRENVSTIDYGKYGIIL